jgi:HD-like signal output (HDOD) protein
VRFFSTELLARLDEIPPLPEVAQQLLQMTESDDFSASEIGDVLARDPAISAKLFQIANSSIYSPEVPVTQVNRAVTLLGNSGVLNMVIGICASVSIPPTEKTERIHEFLWSHSVATGTLAQELARRLGLRPSEELFTAGMFSNLGYLAVSTLLPSGPAMELFGELATGEIAPDRLESFTEDCEELCQRVLEAWAIPEELRQVSAHGSEDPLIAKKQRVLELARELIECKGWWFYSPNGVGAAAAQHAEALGLDGAQIEGAFAGLRTRFDEVAEHLGCSGILLHPGHVGDPVQVYLIGAEPEGLDLNALILREAGLDVIRRNLEDTGGLAKTGTLMLLDVLHSEVADPSSWARAQLRLGSPAVGLLGLSDQVLCARVDEGSGRLYAMPEVLRISDLQRAGFLESPIVLRGSLKELLARNLVGHS